MAELKCNDGTVVHISAETEAELRKAFESKSTYKVGDIFHRNVDGKSMFLQLKADNEGRVALHYTRSSNKVHRGVLVRDINAITYSEVCAMTLYPKGLQHIKTFAVTEL